MKLLTKIAIGTTATVTALGVIGYMVGPTDAMIADNNTDIDRCIKAQGDTDACDRIKTTRGYVLAGSQPTIDIAKGLRKDALHQAEVIKQAAADKAAAERKAAQAKAKAKADAAAAKIKAEAAAAEAKFKAEGWTEQEPGIFVRWCTHTCNNSKVIDNNSYSLLEV